MGVKISLILLLLLACGLVWAQPEDLAKTSLEDLQSQLQAMSDSLLQYREREIISEFGFRDTDRLQDVASKLEIVQLREWKNYLGIEPDNPALDKMSLRKLGISPYRALLAQQFSIYGFTELSTLSDLARQKHLPVKKLREFAGLSSLDKRYDEYSLQALGRAPEQFVAFAEDFNANRIRYGLSITGMGLLIVFSALALTALIIGQLKRLNPKPRPVQAALTLDARGKVLHHAPDLNSDLIAALITTLHLHTSSIEERRRLLLTFHRARTNLWRGSGVLNFPNRDHSRAWR